TYCTTDLAAAIRARNLLYIREQRNAFKEAVEAKTGQWKFWYGPTGGQQHTTTAALAWAIIVDSALLTDQLVQDMKETAASKGCACAPEGWLDYYSPNPSVEARQAFKQYVECRWPIHVFALDPVTEEQNLADTFSSRREMQLAMSLAFVKGQISASNVMRYARRIEFDFATIDLNGTAVGFSHGEDTFGWRFYPRFQSPDIDSNIKVFTQDLLIGGPSKDELLRQRRLEPGIRECSAVVIMPSFVPYATLNVSSNWFSLTDPKCKELDSRQAMKLSSRVKAIENCGPNVVDADCYRDGDLERLLQKAKQLEARLPLQSTQVQVPYEDTLGGFAMFNTGVTDLAPELEGWYGSPSINPKAPTTLFLVGNHFSVHQTRIIAGGQDVGTGELLSRQVMKAVIPADPIVLGTDQKFVDIQLATPYGVTQHLLVPVCIPPDTTDGTTVAVKGTAWKVATFQVAFTYNGRGITAPPAGQTASATGPTTSQPDFNFSPPSLLLLPGDVDPAKYPTVTVKLTFDKQFGVDPISLPANFDATQKAYVIPGATLRDQLFIAFEPKFGPETTNPPVNLVIAAAGLTFNPGPNAGIAIQRKAGNPLTIQWVKAASAQGGGNQGAGNQGAASK
ncbi:MAG TPA: hypothetical protein VMS17_17710, partial [Gemmataceae bacterium]|nr:hypothetical protein [Gemmataceae bacterium]